MWEKEKMLEFQFINHTYSSRLEMLLILDQSKILLFGKEFVTIENIVHKGENGGYQHFLLFPGCFQKAFSTWAIEAIIVG